jgi:hypothetical protein
MPDIPEEKDWNLLRRIKDGKCTPFPGTGACSERIPVSSIANELEKKYDYPMEDFFDLIQVAQFVAVIEDTVTPKEEVCKKINELSKEVTPTYFETPDEIHGAPADPPLPVYITTTYDDLMVRALKSRGKTPIQGICRWNECLMQRKPTSSDFTPTPEKTLVYYLHGCYEIPESLVLTEDVSEARKEKVQKYRDLYFAELNIRVYWQDCHEFVAELKTRWEVFNGGT